MNLENPRLRAEMAIRDLVIPTPFSVRRLCGEIARKRRRRIYLHELPAQASGKVPCGIWFGTDAADHIFFEALTSSFHQDHIILHELGHMLCGHTQRPEPLSSPVFMEGDYGQYEELHDVMTRASYPTEQEQEAEMVASLIMERAGRQTRNPTEQEAWLRGALGP